MPAQGADIGNTAPVRISWVDHSGEKTSQVLHFPAIVNSNAAGNIEGLATDVTGSYDIMKAGLIAITRLNHLNARMGLKLDQSVESLPADQMAQREMAVRWSYVDDVTGQKYRFDTAGPVDALIQSGTDVIDIVANAAALAFVALFEANCVSPLGNAVTMTGARLVGRRS